MNVITQTNCIACGQGLLEPVVSNIGILCNNCSRQQLFRKELIITGITRMKSGICISGIDPKTWRFIRPVSVYQNLKRDFTLDGSMQVIKHFHLIELELTKYASKQIPHTEDWIINDHFPPVFIRQLTDEEIITVLNKMAISDLDLAIARQDKSLFIVKIKKITQMWDEIRDEKFKVRMTFVDEAGTVHRSIPVTDLLTLAFVKYQKYINNKNYEMDFMRIFNNNPYRHIRIGLTREFQGKHWKQITGIITIPDMFDGNAFSYYEQLIGDQV
jgi:hypothetical protein